MSKDEMIVYTNDMIDSCKERIEFYEEDIKTQKNKSMIEARKVIISMEKVQLDYFESVKAMLKKEVSKCQK